jgi:hypothetical protein
MCLLLAVAGANGAGEQGTGDQSPAPVNEEARADFVVGNTAFALLHEFGHAVIRDFRVPILGLEENSADTLAAMTLILSESGIPARRDQSPLSSLLAMAALGNALTWQTGFERTHADVSFWAQHDLSARRAARIVCLLLGSNPERFGWIVDAAKMPEIRADACEDEYGTASYAAEWVASTFGQPRENQSGDEGREITIEYRPTRSSQQAAALALIREHQVAEEVIAVYDQGFRFPEPLTVHFGPCGTPNAFWDPDARQVRFCYELLEAFDQLAANPAVARVSAALRAHEKRAGVGR